MCRLGLRGAWQQLSVVLGTYSPWRASRASAAAAVLTNQAMSLAPWVAGQGWAELLREPARAGQQQRVERTRRGARLQEGLLQLQAELPQPEEHNPQEGPQPGARIQRVAERRAEARWLPAGELQREARAHSEA